MNIKFCLVSINWTRFNCTVQINYDLFTTLLMVSGCDRMKHYSNLSNVLNTHQPIVPSDEMQSLTFLAC